MNMIFQRSIVHDFDLIFQRAKKVDPALECSYPLWKRVCYIKLPKIGSAFFGNRLIKLALSVTLVWGSMHLFLMAHEATTQLVAARAIPFLINHTSLQVIRAGNLFISRVEIAANWAFKKPFRTLFYAWLARKVALSLPCRIPLLTATCEQINLFFVVDALFFAPQNIARFAFWEGFNLAVIGWRASRAISKSLKCFADTHQQKNTALCKEKIEKIWKGLFHLQDV